MIRHTFLRNRVRQLVRRTGFDVVRWPGNADFDAVDRELVARVQPFTLTSPERIVALSRAVEYIVRRAIQGSIVECGVWKGGSMMAVALTLQRLGAAAYDLYMFDTFEGMSEATAEDFARLDGVPASALLGDVGTRATNSVWAYAPLDEVMRNLKETGYDESRLHFVKGKVEATLPGDSPDSIAILRLDTDWYESTRHELIHLYPRLVTGGVLLVDDYGAWAGARKAVDEYFDGSHERPPLLNRIDTAARIGIKY